MSSVEPKKRPPTRRPFRSSAVPSPWNGHCFPKAIRLRRRRDFTRVQRQGARAASEHFTVLIRPVPPGRGKVGFTLSRKVGPAVARNLLRRRLRALFQTHKSWFHGREVVLICQAPATTLTFQALEAAVISVLTRAEENAARRRPPARSNSDRGGR